MPDEPEQKRKRRIPFHTGHVGDGTPVKDARDQRGRKKPKRPKPISRPVKRPSQRGKKGTPGRPRFAYTTDMKQRVREAVEHGMTEEMTAAYAGIAWMTWAKYRDKILKQTRDALATNELKVRKSLLGQAITGSIKHIEFSAKWVFGYNPTQRTELTGAGGKPVEMAVQMTNDDIEARLRTLAADAQTRRAAPRPKSA